MTSSLRRVLITGGAGFIGSHLCERLLPSDEVVVFDNFARNALKFLEEPLRSRIRVIEGDIQDREALRVATEGCQVVIHCAAIAGIYSVGRSPYETFRTNLLGTMNAVEAAWVAQARHFVDFSTSEVYGPFVFRGEESGLTSAGPASEKRWTYAVSKLAGEHAVYAYAQEKGLAVTTVRPFNVYGPRQVGDGAVRGMTECALRNAPIILYNDGMQIRSWCFIDDFVDAILLLIENPVAYNQTLNIGNPQGAATNIQLAHAIVRLSGSSSPIEFQPHPGAEVEVRIPDIERARRLLGFSPKVHLDQGLTRAIEWYREHHAR
jgi:nucleoside-diphosphate-sugar epimerase